MVMARAELFRAQRGLAVTALARVCADAPPMNGVLSGSIYVQNLPSTVVAHALDPQEGDVIIDMCARAWWQDVTRRDAHEEQGAAVCCDKSKRKAVELKRLFSEQLPFDIVHPLRLDSMHSVLPRPAEGERVLSVREVLEKARAETPADAALLKVAGFYPETLTACSWIPVLGAWSATTARARWRRRRPRDLPEHAAQLSLVRVVPAQAWRHARSIRRARSAPTRTSAWCGTRWTTSRWQLVPQPIHVGDTGLLKPRLSPEEAAMVQRFDPSNETLDTMGFFCAKFIKTRSIRDTRNKCKRAIERESVG
ncbi:hypothetical protein PINS_up016714 [Pythium insidiosum]|nr:hypothetical protein PINS_up016714 [Pythium insidiosum]